MNVKQVYDLALRLGIDADPRGKAFVRKELKKEKEAYEKMDDDDKEEFDTERLTNPYADTRILYGDPKRKVKRALVGIDMTTGEVVLADRLDEKGKKIDLILGHHPRGKALAELHDVMHLQEEFLRGLGVPINIAEGVMKKRIAEVERRLMPANHTQVVDAARILDIPIMCTHTPADNVGYQFIQRYLNRKKPETIGDLLKVLKKIDEYKEGVKNCAGPKIIVGDKKKKAGKVIVKFTGGTSPSKEVYKELSEQRIGTVVGMHVPEEHLEEIKKYHMSFVVAGHMSSDSIGMNKICDEMEKKGVEIIPCSGFIRVKRK
ncbi:MAG: NGG1p interacting factor NIF3 [Methanomassiliicoccales archaeon]|nr:MAG: NGG1p interacting factor NIF3 [Methanomassiliicoccales archaeon]